MNLKSTVSDLVANTLQDNSQDSFEAKPFISMLIACGCDYFELAELLANIECMPKDVDFFISLAPNIRTISNLKLTTIHGMIPRWTGSRYHTAPIDQILKDIQSKILSKNLGTYTYNSNFNIRSRKSSNDLYILIVGESSSLFLDINRRQAFQYTEVSGGKSNDTYGDL